MLRRKTCFGLIWACILVLSSSLLCAAQKPASLPDSDDLEDAKPQSASNLFVALAEHGPARASFYLSAKSAVQAENQAAVEKALGCSLEENPRFNRLSDSLNATCDLRLSKTFYRHQGHISLSPLVAYLRSKNIQWLTVHIELPDSETFDFQPAVVPPPVATMKGSAKFRKRWERSRDYAWSLDSPVPEAITFSFGYTQQSFQRALATLAIILVAPILLVFWLGRKALSAPADDKSAVWFSYMRYLQWTLNGALVAWWAASESVRLVPLLKFVSTGWFAEAWNFPVTAVIVDWMPPCLVWILCSALSHPVQQKLRGLKWTRREIVLQGVYSVCAALLPLALFLTGLQTMGAADFQKGMLWFVAAFAVRVIAAAALLRLMGTLPQSLTTGDLRDHAFGLAQRLGVKLQQVYIIPSGKGQMANAFARTGNTIAFTDFLLQRMSRREVNYVLGHELTHLKLKHPNKIAMARVGSMIGAFILVGFAMPFGLESPALRYAAILAIVTLLPLFWSRRFEYAADAGAVELTGDPHAAISALFKLSSLNMMPIHWSNWSEKWLTHPSSLRRAQAIARKAMIPVEQIPEIARASVAENDHYMLPATVAPGAKVLSTQKKQKTSAQVTLALLEAIILVPAAFALLARFFAADPLLHKTFYLAGPVAAFVAYLVFANFAPVSGLRDIIVALKAKLQKDGIDAHAWGGITVGLAPSAAPRIYELNSNWDIGSLFIRSDRICYYGEETKFALRREQVTAIVLAPGVPAFLPPLRIYVAWRDAELGRSGIFNLGCIEGGSMLALRRNTAKVEQILQNWWKAEVPSKPLPSLLAELRSPLIGAVTGTSPRAHWKIGRVLKELFLTGVLAAVTGVLCRLPFHLLAYIGSMLLPVPGRPAYFHSPGAGWYVVAVAVLMRAISLIRLLGYKDKPVVSAPALETAARSSENRGESHQQSSSETVNVH